MNKIVYGSLTFTDAEIVDGEIYQALSLMCDVLEIGTLEVDLYIRDPAVWAALESFKRNDKLLYYHDDKLRGTYYIESVDRTGKYTFTIKANDAIALLEQSSHFGGIYTGQTVAELVKDICNIPYSVQTRFAEVKMYGWLPIDTRRANLAQVLFAVGASAKVDQQGTLRIEALWNGDAQNIPESRVFMGDSVKYEAKVSEVVVLEHQYVKSQEEETLYEGSTNDGDVIRFDEPMHSLTASGFTIKESGANYAVLSGGSGSLTGKRYSHTTKTVSMPVDTTEIPKTVEVEDATLVSLTNSAQVAERLASYYKSYQKITHDVIYNEESPGDVVTFKHPYSGDTFGCIKDASISIGGRLRSSETVANEYRPRYDNKAIVLDQKVILTGSGQWTPPEGVTEVRAVLISGGGKGNPGSPGGGFSSQDVDETDQWSIYGTWSQGQTESRNPSASGSLPSQSAGDGGEGGEAGIPGKVYETTLAVEPGKPISFSCGAAGTVAGEAGADTTFGDLTSADGGILPSGYTDVTTGITYAKYGDAGVKGGRGGAVGQQGESVAGVEGGYGATPKNFNKTDSTPQITTYRNSSTGVELEISSRGRASASISGKGGGGAGGGTAENPGEPGRSASSGTTTGSTGAVAVYANATSTGPGQGGKGADGLKGSTYGSSGGGGHGGGGSGAVGNVSASASASITIECVSAGRCTVGNYGSATARITRYLYSGGQGGDGGDGADGCIILYFGEPKVEISGPVKDKNGKALLDRLGRRIIV